MIKLIASDLDGTLLQNGNQSLKPELFGLIRQLKEKGIHFVAASGRQLASMYRLFEPLKDEITYIGENGTICVYENSVIFRTFFEKDLALEIINDMRNQKGCEILVSCEDKCYMESKDEWYINQIQNVLKNDAEVVDDLAAIAGPFLKISIYSPTNIDENLQEFQRNHQEKVKIATAGNMWIDFMPASANKGACLENLICKLGIKPEECMAFGDQYNDVEMLELVGESYAMTNAATGISRYSDYVTDSVEEVLRELIAER